MSKTAMADALQIEPARDASHIRITTQTALRWREPAQATPLAKGDRRPLQERLEAQERAEMVSVALAQPHRRGSDDTRRGDPLFGFCVAHRLADGLYRAGEEYDRVIRRFKIAKGFLSVDMRMGEGDRVALTEEQIAAMREGAVMREAEASAILRAILPRAPGVMERLCFDRREPSPYDESLIIHCLLALAREFGLLDDGINRGKAT